MGRGGGLLVEDGARKGERLDRDGLKAGFWRKGVDGLVDEGRA